MVENGTFFWNQLVTPDQKTSGDFYGGLLGWSRKKKLTPGLSLCRQCFSRTEKTSRG
jgi:predicted enzyme related to lactoylglutathione lyase